MSDDGTPPCKHVAIAVAQRLSEVEARIAKLLATRTHLLRLAERAAAQDPTECEGFCSIISE